MPTMAAPATGERRIGEKCGLDTILGADTLSPCPVFEIPLHTRAQTLLEADLRLPSQKPLGFGNVGPGSHDIRLVERAMLDDCLLPQ